MWSIHLIVSKSLYCTAFCIFNAQKLRWLFHWSDSDVGFCCVQCVLGAEGLSLAFRHIVSSLLWYCSQHSSEELLHELIICVGYFTVNHPDNQVRLPSLLLLYNVQACQHVCFINTYGVMIIYWCIFSILSILIKYTHTKHILLISKDALNWLKVTVKTFKMLQKICILNKCCSFELSFQTVVCK